MSQLRCRRAIEGGKSSVRECLQVFSPPFSPLVSPRFFFFREFFFLALLSERVEQANQQPTTNTVRNRTMTFTALTFIVVVKEVPFKG